MGRAPGPVAGDDEHLVVETDADSYKVERIRRDPHVRIAECDARGRLRGESVDAEARLLADDERERVERLLARKYRIDRFTVLPVYRLVMRLRGRGSHTRSNSSSCPWARWWWRMTRSIWRRAS